MSTQENNDKKIQQEAENNSTEGLIKNRRTSKLNLRRAASQQDTPRVARAATKPSTATRIPATTKAMS